MTPAILVAGTDRRPSLGLAAAVAVEAASVTGGGTILVEGGEGAQRLGPTMLSARADGPPRWHAGRRGGCSASTPRVLAGAHPSDSAARPSRHFSGPG